MHKYGDKGTVWGWTAERWGGGVGAPTIPRLCCVSAAAFFAISLAFAPICRIKVKVRLPPLTLEPPDSLSIQLVLPPLWLVSPAPINKELLSLTLIMPQFWAPPLPIYVLPPCWQKVPCHVLYVTRMPKASCTNTVWSAILEKMGTPLITIKCNEPSCMNEELMWIYNA
jgi:hypothetical protein